MSAALFAAVDGLAAGVRAHLRAVAAAVPAARPLASSVTADLDRHAAERRRLGAPPDARPALPTPPASLQGLRAAQEALLLAHAEGLVALGDAHAVDVMAHHLVDLSRHLTVTDLWIAAEEP